MNDEELRRLSEAATQLERFIDFTGPVPRYVTANGVRQEMPPRLRGEAKAVRAALRSNQLQVIERDRLARAVDDVRYAEGYGTSDYWRGFNDGIDRLAQALDSTTGDAE